MCKNQNNASTITPGVRIFGVSLEIFDKWLKLMLLDDAYFRSKTGTETKEMVQVKKIFDCKISSS